MKSASVGCISEVLMVAKLMVR